MSRPSCLAESDIAVGSCADDRVLSRSCGSLEKTTILKRILMFQNEVLIKTGSEPIKKMAQNENAKKFPPEMVY